MEWYRSRWFYACLILLMANLVVLAGVTPLGMDAVYGQQEGNPNKNCDDSGPCVECKDGEQVASEEDPDCGSCDGKEFKQDCGESTCTDCDLCMDEKPGGLGKCETCQRGDRQQQCGTLNGKECGKCDNNKKICDESTNTCRNPCKKQNAECGTVKGVQCKNTCEEKEGKTCDKKTNNCVPECKGEPPTQCHTCVNGEWKGCSENQICEKGECKDCDPGEEPTGIEDACYEKVNCEWNIDYDAEGCDDCDPDRKKNISDLESSKSLQSDVKDKEGLTLKPKEDVSGMCHIGHGHLIEYGKGCDEVSKERIKEIDGLESIDDTITEDEAQEILEQDIDNHEQAAKKHLSDKTKLTQNQYDALVSFTYNTGGPDYEASGVPDLINSGSSNQVVQEKIKNFQNEDVGDRRKNEAKEFSC